MFWLWLVLIQLVVFTLLVVFLKIILTRNVSSATAHLHELNQDYNQKVEDANKRKQEVDKYYDELLIKAKADAEKNKVQILREAQATQETIIKEARQQSEDIIGQAQRAQEMVMAEIESKIETRSIDRACEMVNVVFSSEISEAIHREWVKELLKTGLGDLEKLHVPDDLKEVQIVSAFPLNESERSALENKLKKTLRPDIAVVEKIQPEMIAGLQVQLGSLIIDGSLRYKIKEAARDVKRV